MSYDIKIVHNPNIDAYILEYGDTDVIVLCSDTYESAVEEARGIVAEWV
jgi:hypothetical protein